MQGERSRRQRAEMERELRVGWEVEMRREQELMVLAPHLKCPLSSLMYFFAFPGVPYAFLCVPLLLPREPIPVLSPNTNPSQVQRARQEGAVEAIQCQICFDSDKSVLLNCGHQVCAVCDTGIRIKCPFCQQPITSRSPIFL